MIEVLVRAAFHTHVFQFLTDVEAAFEDVTVDYIFEFCTHEGVTLTGFYMEEIDTEIQFAIHTDTSSDLNVLSVNHIAIFLIICCYLIVSAGKSRSEERRVGKESMSVRSRFLLRKKRWMSLDIVVHTVSHKTNA